MNFLNIKGFRNLISKTQGQKILQFSNYEGNLYKVNNFEKKCLVWTGKFKTVEEVPAYVTYTTIDRCKNRMRIKIANYMMAATLVGCLGMVYLGKQAAKKGETLQKINLDWHKEMEAKMDEKNK